MAVLMAVLTMVALGAFTTWLSWAARRSDAVDRLVGIVAMAGQCAPLLGRETVAHLEHARRPCIASTGE